MMKNSIFTNLTPLMISSILIIYHSVFSDKLEEVNISNLDNCVLIILNTPYCNDCFDQLIKYQEIWSKDYKTILVVKSSKNKLSVLEYKKYFKIKIDYDDLIFIEKEIDDFNLPIQLFEYKIRNSPSLIIIKDKQLQFIDFQYLYKGNYIKELKDRLNAIFKF